MTAHPTSIEVYQQRLVNYFDGRRRQAGYRGGIEPDLAPWAQLLGRVTARFDLDEYPQDELRAALNTFAEEHESPANSLIPTDWDAVSDLLLANGGWQA